MIKSYVLWAINCNAVYLRILILALFLSMCYDMISRYIIIQTGELKMQKKTLGQYRFTPKLIRPFAIDEKTFQECLSALSNEKSYISNDEQFVGIMKMYYAQLNTVKNSVQLL